MWVSIQFEYHEWTDVSNRWEACNEHTHSSEWKKGMSDELYTAILWKERDEVFDIILKHIDDTFWTVDMKACEQRLAKALEKDKEKYIKKMEALTKHPIPYKQITCFLTTLPRCPYHRQKWFIRMWYKAKDPVRIFLHETLHFQFHWRYTNTPMVQALSKEQFSDFKESLTFLLNNEFKEFIEIPDVWYPQHQELRKKLEEYRVSSDKDFEKLIEYGCTLLTKN